MQEEVLDALKSRRSIRKFKKEQISREELDLVLEVGTYAPTSGGTQDPVIVAVQDPATVARIDALNAKILNMSAMPHPYYGAPTILLVLAPRGGHAPVEDASLVAGNMLNAAYAVGLAACYIHRSREMFDSSEGKKLLQEWELSDDLMGVCSIALGYPDGEAPRAAARKENYIVYV